jgi:hypothetical protein
MPARPSRPALALAAVAAALAVPAAASAASASLSVTDPTAEIARVHTLDYRTPTPTSVYVAYRPTGGQPCAPRRIDDPGTAFGSASGRRIDGAGSYAFSFTFARPGAYQVCTWFADSAYALPEFTTTQVLEVRAPVGSLTLTPPATLRPGVTARLVVGGQTEVDRSVYVKVRNAGGQPCAPTAADDPGRYLDLDSSRAAGAFGTGARLNLERGRYLVCGWLAPGSYAAPTATAQTTLTVGAPPATATAAPALTALRTRGRRVSLTAWIPGPGRVTVTLVRRGTVRTTVVTGTRTTGARRVSTSWTLPRRVASGRFALVVSYAADTGGIGTVRRAVTLR